MNKITLCNKTLGESDSVFVIAEAGINHNGDMDIARKLIDSAKKCGADAVKFQTFTSADLMTHDSGVAHHLDVGAGEEDVYSFVDRISLDKEKHQILWQHSMDAGISFLSSVFSLDAVDLLEEVGVEAYKIASMDIDNLELLKYASETGKPIIISTGMSSLAEVERAFNTIYNNGNSDVILLHCTSQYPAAYEDVNLRAMETLKATFGTLVGLSDHTIGNEVAIAAVALGAVVIEKHFTLDRSMAGPDHAISADVQEFTGLVNSIRRIESSLGDFKKKPVAKELEMAKAFRRSIVSTVEIPIDTIITKDMLTYKRPGSGISPADIKWVIKRKTKSNIPADTVISIEQLY